MIKRVVIFFFIGFVIFYFYDVSKAVDIKVSNIQQSTFQQLIVINNLSLPREDEVIIHTLELNDSTLLESKIDSITVYNITKEPAAEVLSDHLDSSIMTYASGYIKSMDIIFQDDFAAKETTYYEIRMNDVTTMNVTDLFFEDTGDTLEQYHINNGLYDYYIGHVVPDSIFGSKIPECIVRHLRIKWTDGFTWTEYDPLNWIYGNLLNLEDWGNIWYPILSYGFPSSVCVENSRVMLSITFKYDNAWYWASYWDGSEIDGPYDNLSAEVNIRIYRNKPQVDVIAIQNIHRSFYNHNGFRTEISRSDLSGCDILFSDENHQILDCSNPNAQWMHKLQDKTYIFIEADDAEGHTPFDTLATTNLFYDYYVLENSNDKATLVHIPDWGDLAYLDTYTDDGGYVIPRNALYVNSFWAGPSSCSHVLSGTGLGSGWIPALINSSSYISKSSFVPDMVWTTNNVVYDQQAKILSTHLAVEELLTKVWERSRIMPITNFGLSQNYPNPFNPSTTITYQLPKATIVNLSIYNITGQLVETLVNGHKNAGYYSVEWNARNVGSGLYFYQIEAGEYTETRKCVILK